MALPPPTYDERLWAASCRPVSSLNRFSETVLCFQPDSCLICPNGLNCGLRRGLGCQRHNDLFIHASSETIRASTAAAKPVPVANHPGRTVMLPRVKDCYELQAHAVCIPPGLRHRHVHVWVHGFRQRFFRVIAVASHLVHQLASHSGQESSAPSVVAFLWPCHARKAAYGLARADAMRAAPHLRTTLQALTAAGCHVTVIAHSMGSRVALQALTEVASGAREEGLPPLCAELILLGAAVDAGCLTARAEFDRTLVRAAQVHVLFSANDEVLKAGFRLGEAMSGKGVAGRALGLHGVLGGALPEATTNVDVSSSVDGHNPNSWLLSPDVMAVISPSAGQGAVESLRGPLHAVDQSWAAMTVVEEDDDVSEDDDNNGDGAALV